MIVNDTAGRNDYVGAGSATAFAYTFGILAESDIEVLVNGSVKLLNSDYSVSGIGNDSGGSVTFVLAPTGAIVLQRKQPIAHTSRYPLNEEFPAPRIENDFAKQAMISQMLRTQLRRTLQLQPNSTFLDAIIADPIATSLFLRVSSLSPLTLDWATLATAGAISLPLSLANGGSGANYGSASALAAGLSLARWASSSITPSGGILTLPNPLTGNAVVVGSGNFSSISTGGVPTGMVLMLHYNSGSNVITDGSALVLEGRANYTTVAGDRSIFILSAAGWVELLRIPLHVSGDTTKFRRGDGTWQTLPAQSTPSGVVQGLTVNNATGDPTNDLTVDIGDAFSDEANPASRISLYLATAITKQLDATWAAGDNAGGRVSGQTLADGTWHVFLFKRSGGAIDVCFSNSLTFTTPDSGTNRICIMSMLRIAGAWSSFIQEHDYVQWKAPTVDHTSVNPGSLSHLALMRVPTGMKFMTRYNIEVNSTGIQVIAYTSDPATNDLPITTNMITAPLAQLGFVNVNLQTQYRQLDTMTNVNGQIRYRTSQSDAATALRLATLGFFHKRGRG